MTKTIHHNTVPLSQFTSTKSLNHINKGKSRSSGAEPGIVNGVECAKALGPQSPSLRLCLLLPSSPSFLTPFTSHSLSPHSSSSPYVSIYSLALNGVRVNCAPKSKQETEIKITCEILSISD